MTELSLYYCTFPDIDSAQLSSRYLLEHKLAACTNLIPGVLSQYWWEGKITGDSEVILIIKSYSHYKDKIQQALQDRHPYKNFCLIELNTKSINEKYQQWLTDSLTTK